MKDDAENIKFAEEQKIDLYVPSRAQAQEFDRKEQSLNHDNYEYDWKKDELIVGKERFYFKYAYTRKNGKKILMYYNDKLKKKKEKRGCLQNDKHNRTPSKNSM